MDLECIERKTYGDGGVLTIGCKKVIYTFVISGQNAQIGLAEFCKKHKRQGQHLKHHRTGAKLLFGFEIFNSTTVGANTCEPVSR